MDMRKMKKAELLSLATRLAEDNQTMRENESKLYRTIEHWKYVTKIAFISDAAMFGVLMFVGLLLRSNLCH